MGFIGSHLAETLLADGHQVTAVDNLSTGCFENIQHLVGHPNYRFAIEDITNEVVLDRLVSRCDVIFHLAAAVGVKLIVHDPVHTVETNVLGHGGRFAGCSALPGQGARRVHFGGIRQER